MRRKRVDRDVREDHEFMGVEDAVPIADKDDDLIPVELIELATPASGTLTG